MPETAIPETGLNTVEVGDGPVARVRFGPGLPLAWIAGPCVIESRGVMAAAAGSCELCGWTDRSA